MMIRKFVPEDAEKLSQLIVRNLRLVNIRDYSKETIEALATYFAPDTIIDLATNSYTIVCTHEGHIVGIAVLDKDRVRNVFVEVEMHKQGVGRLLMAAIEAHAIEINLIKIYLYAGLSAQGFYSKLGYKTINRIEHDLDGNPLPVIKMEKILFRV